MYEPVGTTLAYTEVSKLCRYYKCYNNKDTVFVLPLLSHQGLSLKFVQTGDHCMNHQPQKLTLLCEATVSMKAAQPKHQGIKEL